MDNEENEENHDEEEKDDVVDDEVSPSPALEIEGVVRGEADNGGVQSEGGNFINDDENEVKSVYLFIVICI